MIKTIDAEFEDYKIRLYTSSLMTSDSILLCDIFINNPNKDSIEIIYRDKHTIEYRHYQTKTVYHNDSNGGYSDKIYINKQIVTINLNDIYDILKDYSIYNVEHTHSFNVDVIMATFAGNEFFRQFAKTIEEP